MRVRDGMPQGQALIVYPELHLFGTDDHAADRIANRCCGPRPNHWTASWCSGSGAIARAAGAWLIPGSVCEAGRDGELFNTALVFAPDGALAGSYRKVFPWRPFEPYTPGDRFVTVDIDNACRLGISICYDAWFPEVSRHLAWMGADIVVNIVKTTTQDRAQELVLARANSIVNQVFTVSVNCAGPVGAGRSIVVDPEGGVLQESAADAPGVLYQRLDPARSNASGTAEPRAPTGCGRSSGPTTRPWSCRSIGAASIPLPGPRRAAPYPPQPKGASHDQHHEPRGHRPCCAPSGCARWCSSAWRT